MSINGLKPTIENERSIAASKPDSMSSPFVNRIIIQNNAERRRKKTEKPVRTIVSESRLLCSIAEATRPTAPHIRGEMARKYGIIYLPSFGRTNIINRIAAGNAIS